MHIIVGQTMAEEKSTMQLWGTGDGVHLVVTLRVLLWRTHIPLGINRVVETPAGRRSDCHSGTEDGAPLRHGHQRVPTAVRPSPDADTVFVDIRLLAEPQRSLHLIAGLELAQTEVGTFLELSATAARASVVDTDTHIALLGQVLLEDGPIAVHADAPLVQHLLVARTAILIHDDRVAFRRVKVGRLDHPSVQDDAFGCSKGEELFLS